MSIATFMLMSELRTSKSSLRPSTVVPDDNDKGSSALTIITECLVKVTSYKFVFRKSQKLTIALLNSYCEHVSLLHLVVYLSVKVPIQNVEIQR